MILKALALVLCITQFCYAIESEREIGGLTDETLTTFDESEDNTLASYSETPDAKMVYQVTRKILKNLLYRLDIVPCKKTETPNEGQGIIYKTIVYYNRQKRKYMCYSWVSKSLEKEFDEDKNTIFLTPQTCKNGKYCARTLERYHIKCPKEHFCKLQFELIDLQEKVEVNGNMICLDYIQIYHENAKTICECCGNKINNSCNIQIFKDSVYATFRSGPNTQRTGFNITIEKFQKLANAEMKKGCLQENSQVSVEDYLQYNSVPIPRGGYGRDSDGDYTNDRYRGDYEDDRRTGEDNRRTGEDDEDNQRFREDYVRFRRNSEDKGPFREHEYNDYNDYMDIEREMNQFIPRGAKQMLYQFYMENHAEALAESIDLNEGIVRLATISVDSCDPSLSAIAQNVLSLFRD